MSAERDFWQKVSRNTQAALVQQIRRERKGVEDLAVLRANPHYRAR